MDLLAAHRAIHHGRKQVSFHPGDVRKLSLIIAAKIFLVPITDLTLPEDLSGVSEMYRETSIMAI